MKFQLVPHHNTHQNAYVPFRLKGNSGQTNTMVKQINEQFDRYDGVLDRFSHFDSSHQDLNPNPGGVTVAQSRFGRSRYDVALEFAKGEDQPITRADVHRNGTPVLTYNKGQDEQYIIRLHDTASGGTTLIYGEVGGEARVTQ